MNLEHIPAQTSVNTRRHDEAETRLQGHWLRLAQAVWILVAVLSFFLFVVSIPMFYAQIRSVCAGDTCNGVQISAEQAHALEAHGISLTGYALYSVSVAIISTLIWFSAGWLIFWRKSNYWIALLVALQLVTQGATNSTSALEHTSSVWQYPATLLDFLNTIILFMVFALFPNGRFVPKWTRWLVLVWVASNVLFYPNSPLTQFSWFPTFSFLLWISFMGMVVVAQIYRYHSVSTPVQRQQTKWVVFAFATIILSQLVLVVPMIFSPVLSQPGSLYTLISANIMIFVLLLGPVSVYIAIVRYRLYDIDVIIRRTLVYGTLTTILALVYFGLIIVLQILFQGLIGRTNDVAIVASTLIIAAIFQPLRHSIQQFIDRRFYRRKYDAAKTLAAFSATLRNEVDLSQLHEHLVATVTETMRPQHVSLWLSPPERTVKQQLVDNSDPLASSWQE